MANSAPLPPDAQRSRLLAWWELLRAGNVFTAASNVIAGFLLTQREWQPVGPLLLLVFSSMLLYEAGMVLNDVFDAELDAVERPERPIPSGRISRGVAFRVGLALLGLGLFSTGLTSWFLGDVAPLIVGSTLAIAIVLYDSGLKNTWAGPLTMGWCRLLNVLLGASIAADRWGSRGIWWFAIGVGVYTVGITQLAKHETDCKEGFSPSNVRRQVKGLLLGFIVIDAMVAAGAAGWMSGLALLCLLIPTLIASRWAPMT